LEIKSLVILTIGLVIRDVNVGLSVLSHSLLEKVGLSLKTDHLHPLEWVLNLEKFWHSESKKEMVSDELDVLRHQSRVHTDQLDGQRLGDETHLDLNSLTDNGVNFLVGQFVVQVLVDETCEVGVHALISRDELIGEGQTGHQASLFEPEDRTEAATEENALDACECHKSLCEGALISNPFQGPLSFLSYRRNVLNGIQQKVFLGKVRNVSVNDERICLRVNVLHHDLEPVEAPSLWNLDLCHEALSEVLKHYAVWGREESKDYLDEVLLVGGQLWPIFEVLLEIDFLGGPEGSHMLLVHFPNVRVLDGQNHEAVGVLIQKRFWEQIHIDVGQVFVVDLLLWEITHLCVFKFDIVVLVHFQKIEFFC
jgi:hypothetical protein